MGVVMVMEVSARLNLRNIRSVVQGSYTVASTNGIVAIEKATVGIVRVGRNGLL